MTTLTRSTFTQILYPPTILTPGREIEVRVMRPERPMTAAADGTPKWSRPQLEDRQWFGSAEALAGWKAPQDRHVWVAGALREGRDGTKAGVVASACLWADLDAGGDEALGGALAELERRELLPTLIVRSSPGKHHLWWRLDEPMALGEEEAKRRFERALVGITALVVGDGAVVDCSRVLRLPGTRNVKPWYGEPPPVEVIEAHPDRVHAFRRFAELVPPAPTKPARASKGVRKAAGMTPRDPAPSHPGLPHLDRCLFVRHCREHATTLPEPLWADLAWTLAPNGHPGDVAFHDLSRAHPGYEAAAADAKLRFARERDYHPPSCRKIGEHGFACPKMDAASGACTLAAVRSPAGLIETGPMADGSAFLRWGKTWRFNSEDPPSPLADFTVRFTDEIVLPEGTKRIGLDAVTPGGRVHRLEVPGEALADPKDFGRRLAGAMGTDYRGLDARNLPVARDAWLATSEIRSVRVSREFGFAADGASFTGLDLTPDGELRFEVPTAVASYLGLKTAPDTDVDDALHLLLDRWPRVACGDLAARAMLGVGLW